MTDAGLGNFGTYTIDGVYAAGVLTKLVSVNEQNKQIIEFKDKDGRVILKKVQNTAPADGITGSGYTGWLCTYYIYDILGNLRCVLQPVGTEIFLPIGGTLGSQPIAAEQCFRYEYDASNRMIMKKTPGAEPIYMVYDSRDRVMMTQDGNLRALNKWAVVLYDDLNRPVQTGLLMNTFNGKTFAQHMSAAYAVSNYPFTPTTTPSVSYWEYLGKIGYDNYDFIPVASGLNATLDNSYTGSAYMLTTYNTSPDYAQAITKSNNTNGLPTWTETKIVGTSGYAYSVNLYDEKARLIQVKSKNYKTGSDLLTTQYNWAGQPLVTVQKVDKPSSTAQTNVIITKNTYDDLGRVKQQDKKVQNTLVNGNVLPPAYTTIVKNEYDGLGQLEDKKMGNKPGAPAGTPLATLDHDYNIRGLLTAINKNFIASSVNADY